MPPVCLDYVHCIARFGVADYCSLFVLAVDSRRLGLLKFPEELLNVAPGVFWLYVPVLVQCFPDSH